MHDRYDTYNGMAAADLKDVVWQKSLHSNSQGNCVEFAALPGATWRCATRAFPMVRH